MRFVIPATLFFVAVAMVASCAAADSSPNVFHLELAHDQTRDATFIQPRADGTIAYLTVDSTMEYVTMVHVRRIMDGTGVDVTKRALERREWLGVSPTPQRAPRSRRVWRPFRLRAGPERACHAYMITDFAMMNRSGGPEYREAYWSTDLGYARNIGSRHSIGASGFLGAYGSDRTQLGLRAHLVGWVGSSLSVDVAPGILLAEQLDYSRLRWPGVASQVSLNWGGRVGIVAQVLSENRTQRRQFYGPFSSTPPTDYEVKETTWHVGVRLGAEPGIAGSALLLLAEWINQMSTKVYSTGF